MVFTPDLLTFEKGGKVTTPEAFAARRKELVRLICEEEFGFMPPLPQQVTGEVAARDTESLNGLGVKETLSVRFDTEKGDFTLPARLYLPADAAKKPFGLVIAFGSDETGPSFPADLLLTNGFAVVTVANGDISSDDNNFSDKLAGMYTRTGRGDEWGKLALWMFGTLRVLDYLLTREEIDPKRVAICGHSRLGKAALYAGAVDERITFVLANNSGCGGDALEQAKHENAETVPFMNNRFGFWFCRNHRKYSEIPLWETLDQHFLVGAIAPRYVAIASAEGDRWADPYAQQLCAVAASPAWEVCDLSGYVGPEAPLVCGQTFNDGHIAYHLREGGHSLSRYDWEQYVAFMKKHS